MKALYRSSVSVLLAVSCLAAVTACAHETGTPSEQSDEALGTLSAALSATSSTGVTYRLRNATVAVLGTTIQFSSEDYLTTNTVSLPLPTGNYQLFLGGSWYLERTDGTATAPIAAQYLLPNPQPFTIAPDQTTTINLQFSVAGNLLTLGDGHLNVGVSVDDVAHETGSLCTDRIDNDGDAAVDCGDSDCYSNPACTVAPPAAGSVVVTEIMVDPNAVLDATGEWFELYNPGTNSVSLAGCEVRDGSGALAATLPAPTYVYPGEYRVFAVNPDPTVNGGIPFSEAVSAMQLGNAGDGITLTCPTTSGGGGARIVTVIPQTFGVSFLGCYGRGYSCQLNPTLVSTGSLALADYCPGTSIYGQGDRGTPGLPNLPCP